jgi:hypothetical protein
MGLNVRDIEGIYGVRDGCMNGGYPVGCSSGPFLWIL